MSFSFQFPHNWPSYIHCFAVFPRQIPIPINWLETKNIDSAYHPLCNCHLYTDCLLQDPVISAWYIGICPYKYPYSLYKYVQNMLIVDSDDILLTDWLQESRNLELISFLSDLEYFVHDEFHSFLSYPMTIFYFVRYSKMSDFAVELKAKVFGLAHNKVLISASVSLGDINKLFKIDQNTKTEWKSQLFFAVLSAMKIVYFDKFLTIHSYLDNFKEFETFDL